MFIYGWKGTDPGMTEAKYNPAIPIIAKRPFLISTSRPRANVSSVFPADKLNGSYSPGTIFYIRDDS